MKVLNLILVSSAVLVLSACSKLSVENYEKIEVGMTQDVVESHIGGADSCEEPTLGTYTCEWSSGDKSISVKFAGESVAYYSKDGF